MTKCEGSPGQHSGELANGENVIFSVLPLKQEMDLWSCVFKTGCVGWSPHLVNLVRELSGLLVVDGVGVQQGAERLEVGLLLQQRDKVVSVAGESGGDDFPDLALNVIGLQTNEQTSLTKKPQS